MTFYRTINSSIQDKLNKEFQKIKKVDITIDEKNLIVNYSTMKDFDKLILKNWNKTVTVPKKAASYLNKEYKFMINNETVNYNDLIS